MWFRFFLSTCLAFAFAEAAQANDVPTKPGSSSSATPDIDPGSGFFGTGIIVEGSTTSSKAKATVQLPPSLGTFRNSNLSFSFETDLNKNSPFTDLVTNFSLNGDVSAGVNYTFQDSDYIPDVNSQVVQGVVVDAVIKCREMGYPKDKCVALNSKTLLENSNKIFLSKEGFELLDAALNRKALDRQTIRNFGISAAVGLDSQSFRDPMSFEKSSISKKPFGVSAFFGLTPRADTAETYFIGASHEVEYKSATSQTLCRDMDDSDILECFSGSYAEPTKVKSTKAYALARRYWNLGSGAGQFPLGIEAKVAYDFSDDEIGFEVPIFLVPDKSGNLISGIRLRYDEGDEDDLSIGFFIGQKFDLNSKG